MRNLYGSIVGSAANSSQRDQHRNSIFTRMPLSITEKTMCRDESSKMDGEEFRAFFLVIVGQIGNFTGQIKQGA